MIPFSLRLRSPHGKRLESFLPKSICVYASDSCLSIWPGPISKSPRKRKKETFLISNMQTFIIHLNGISFNNILVFRVYPSLYVYSLLNYTDSKPKHIYPWIRFMKNLSIWITKGYMSRARDTVRKRTWKMFSFHFPQSWKVR